MAAQKTTDQLRAIFGLGKKKGLEKSDLEALAADVTDGVTDRLSALSFGEANAIIVRLGGEAFPVSPSTPRRTVNYRKQKAGIKTVETSRHLDFIAELARKRGITPEGLERLCLRVIKKSRPVTTAEGNKIVEALKSMIRRDEKSKTSTRRAA